MNKLITFAAAVLTCLQMPAQELFPDGTPVDKWFTEKASVKTGKRYVITDYNVVKDSTIVQTEAIQKVIDLASDKGGGTIVIPEGT